MSKLVEKMAQANYERFMEGLIGCCEEPWAKLPEQHRERLIEAQRAALAVVMAEMRADMEARYWGSPAWISAPRWLENFEKEQAGG